MFLTLAPAAAHATVVGQTDFARSFISAIDPGGEWLLVEVERLLNARQKTVATMREGDLDFITSIGLAGRGIHGHIPPAIGHLRNLEHLFLSGNNLTNGPSGLPNQLFSLSNLRNIDLSNNLYTGPIDSRFSQLPLEVLRLSGNDHTGGIPVALTQIPTLRMLDLSDNRLTGGVIPELANLNNLRYLELSRNPLGGSIPAELTTMTNLEVLAIWSAELTGEIPATIGNMTALQYIDLGINRLTGEIPVSIGNLIRLRELTISFNRITGTVPDIFQNMNRLEEVHIDENYLRGHIPQSLFDRFLGGTEVTFSWNYMTGPNALAIEQELGIRVSHGNFVDGSSAQQFRLTTIRDIQYIRVAQGEFVDLWRYLENVVATGSTLDPKPMRPYNEYVIFVTNPADASRVEIHTNGGLFVRLSEEVLWENAISITIKIRNNYDSEFSRVTFGIGTGPGPTGPPGVGGGGGIVEVTPPDVPLVGIIHHMPYLVGYPDGEIKGDRNISREEAAVILFRIREGMVPREPASEAPFFDVSATRWSSGYIEYAKVNGLLQVTRTEASGRRTR